MDIKPAWITWAKNTVNLLRDGGHMTFQKDGAIFKVNHVARTLTLVCCKPSWLGSEVEGINREVFSRIGYQYIVPPDTPTNAEAMTQRIVASPKEYVDDLGALLAGMEIIFSLPPKSLDRIIQELMGKAEKNTLNPVTFRGENGKNVAIGRMWLGENSVPDSSHKFNPAQIREQWDKVVTFVFWEGEGDNIETPQGMVTSEEAFFPLVRNILAGKKSGGVLHGTATRVDYNRPRSVAIEVKSNQLRVSLHENGSEIAFTSLHVGKFTEGLSYLCPNNELKV